MSYEQAALIHVISAVVMSRSEPMKLEITRVAPVVMEVIATAMVAVRTKRTSDIVESKHGGRASGFAELMACASMDAVFSSLELCLISGARFDAMTNVSFMTRAATNGTA